MYSSANLLALSNRVYYLLLYLYPARFRREYGYDMAQVFRDDVRGTLQEGGSLAVLDLWILALVDLVKTAVAEHFMPIEKLTRWSGPAGAIGGLLFAMGVALTIYGGAPYIISLLVIVPLLGLGLFGLYKCLPTTVGRLNTFAFTVSVIGLLMYNIFAAIGAWLDNLENNWAMVMFFGFGLWIMGFAGMGIIAIVKQALGRLSFTPLLVPVAFIGLVLFGKDPTSPIGITLLTTYAASWILFGVALWQAYREPSEPGLFA